MVKRKLEINFTEEELTCKCGCGLQVCDFAIIKLQALRLMIGKPLHINSSVRCAKHNKHVGGAPDSRHLNGIAFDIRIDDTKVRERIIRIAPTLGFKGIGIGEKFIHIDLRSESDSAIWIYK